MISLLAIAAGTVVGWIYYEPIFDVISEPDPGRGRRRRCPGPRCAPGGRRGDRRVHAAGQGRRDGRPGSGLPIWIYQLWAFVLPGLHTKERRWVYLFVVLSVPLFLSGVVLAYVLMPKGLEVLLGFTPQNVGNYLPVDRHLSFFIRMVIVFGIGFLTPLFIVGLNMIGVLSGKRLASAWRYIIFGVFVFAAVATPRAIRSR